jgi:hypothetical protein
MKIMFTCSKCGCPLKDASDKRCHNCDLDFNPKGSVKETTVYSKTESLIARITDEVSKLHLDNLSYDGSKYIQGMGTMLSALLVKRQMEIAGQLPIEYDR